MTSRDRITDSRRAFLTGLRICALAVVAMAQAGCDDGTGPGPNPEPGKATPWYVVEDGFIQDDLGRVWIPRGLNYSNDHKYPDPSTGKFLPSWESKQDFVHMAGWGFNSVRLLVVWEAIEPERGVYDKTYLDGIAERLDWAEESGMRVIIDMHQDLYSRFFGGDGAPSWAVFTDGIPFKFRSPWWLNFLAPALHHALNHFFGNYDTILDHFVESWRLVVQRLGDHPALMGFELLNEPFPGEFLFRPGKADEEIFNPFYHRLLAALAPLDDRHLFFVEPNAVRTNMLVAAFPTKMDSYQEAKGRLVFAPHLYDPLVTITGKYNGNDIFIRAGVNGSAGEAVRLGWGLWVGEWSVWDGHVQGYDEFLRDQMAAMDKRLAGWAYWNYSLNPADQTSPINSPEFLDELARPQLSVVAGRPLEIDCKHNRCRFQYEEKDLSVPTEVLVPQYWSPNPSITVQPDRRTEFVECKPAAVSKLSIYPDADGAEVLVTVERQAAGD